MHRTIQCFTLMAPLLFFASKGHTQENDRCRQEGAVAAFTKRMAATTPRERFDGDKRIREQIEAAISANDSQSDKDALLKLEVTEDVYSNPEVSQFSHFMYRVSVCVNKRAGKPTPKALTEVVPSVLECQKKYGTEHSNPLAICIAATTGSIDAYGNKP